MYARALALAEAVNRHTNLEITVEATGGSPALISAVTDEIMDIAGPNDITLTTDRYYGTGRFADNKNQNIRVLIALGGIYFSYVTRYDSGIKTLADLKGKTVPRYTASDWHFFNLLIEEFYGLNPGVDFEEIARAENSVALDDLIMGRIDAMQVSANSRFLLPMQEAIGKIRFLPLPSDQVSQLKAKYPDRMRARFPAVITPTFLRGIEMDGPIDVVSSFNTLITNPQLDEDVAYTIVKTLLEYQKEYQETVIDYTLDTAAFVPDIPFHPGAVRAFEEAGLWTDAMEKRQQELIAAE